MARQVTRTATKKLDMRDTLQITSLIKATFAPLAVFSVFGLAALYLAIWHGDGAGGLLFLLLGTVSAVFFWQKAQSGSAVTAFSTPAAANSDAPQTTEELSVRPILDEAVTLPKVVEAIESLPHSFALFDQNERLVLMNAQFVRLFAAFANRIHAGMAFSDLAAAMANSGLIVNAIGNEEEWIAARVAQHRSADGKRREVEIGSRWLQVNEFALANGGVVMIHYDVTDRKKGEVDLVAAKEAAELADRAKSQFLANMTHELRTPLNAVIGFAEVLRDELFGPLGDKQYYDFVADIHASGQHLLELIDDILDLSKIEVGQRELQAQPMNVDRTIEAAVRMVRQRAAQNDIHLDVDVEQNLPPLNGEERGIKQILINLLSNAIKFTPKDGRVSVIARASADHGLVISVADTGIGIAPQDIPLAFAPFVQIDSTHARQYEGTGLGLPLVKSLVEMHGGTVRIDSEVDKGTTVIVHLPADRIDLRSAER